MTAGRSRDDAAEVGAAPLTASRAAGQTQDARTLLRALHELRKSQVDAAYWASFCELVAALCRSRAAVVLTRSDPAGWLVLARGGADARWLEAAAPAFIEELAQRAGANGFAYTPTADAGGDARLLAAVRVLGQAETLLLLDIAQQERGMLNELMMRAMLVAAMGGDDLPGEPQPASQPAHSRAVAVRPAPQAAAADDPGLLALLDLQAQVMETPKFELATLKLANGLAAHYGLMICAIGWRKGRHIEAVAISHLERFERRTRNVRLIEAVFDEAAAGEVQACHPAADGIAPGGNALAELCDALGYEQACVLPQRDAQGNVRSVLLFAFERRQQRLPALGSLALVMDMLHPWLTDLQQRDRWWGRRFAGWIQRHLEVLVGPGHPWIKTLALAACAGAFYAVFGTWNYRLEATAQLTTDQTRVVSAQFDGRVEQVMATAGDLVRQGAILAVLDTRDLRQQEAEIQADRTRFEAEAARHRAEGNLADMEVALARLAQVEARVARLQEYIGHARSLAPFDGVVVEGERKDLTGMPVKKGDRLFRIAQVQGLYATLHVPERDVREIRPGARGELSLLSRPEQKIPFEVSALIPVAQVKGQDGNHFMLTARLLSPPESWWRPGMTGLARIDVGERNVTWVATHRLVDALRMKLWW